MITSSIFKDKFDEMLALSYEKRPITPLEEPAINVYLNTRKIDLPSNFQELAVQGDHKAETIWFALDRYFDGEDLIAPGKVWVAQFVNAAGEASMTSLMPQLGGAFTGDEVDDKTIRLGWEITNDVTKAAGIVTFSLRCYTMDENGMLSYNIGTEPTTARISKGLIISAGSGSTLPQASDLERLVDRIEKLYDKYYGTLTNISYGNIITNTLPMIDDVILLGGDNKKHSSLDFECADFSNLKNKPKITVDGVEKTIGEDFIEVTKITVDSALNATSEQPVQNKVITNKINVIDENISTVNEEIQKLWIEVGDMTYIPLKINQFTNNINYVEKNHELTGPIVFNWEVEGNVASQEIKYVEGETVLSIKDIEARTFSHNFKEAFINDATFTLTVRDKKENPTMANTQIIFTYKVFYGAAPAPDGDYTPDFITNLKGSSLQETKETTFTIDRAENEYIYFALPQSYGTPVFSVGGFEGGFGNAPVKTITYNETNYDIWRSDNMITATNREIKVV